MTGHNDQLQARHEIASAFIAGERAADRAIREIANGFAPPDRFLTDLRDLAEADGVQLAGTPRVRGWARRIAKFIEAKILTAPQARRRREREEATD